MPKLSQVRQQLKARAQAPQLERQQAQEAQSLAQARATAESALIERIRDAVGFRETDLSPVLDAIASVPNRIPKVEIPKPEKVDLSGVIDRLEALLKREFPKIPKPRDVIVEPTDLSPLLADLQWLKSFLALKKDPVMPEPKTKWTFRVIRDRNGFIQSIEAE